MEAFETNYNLLLGTNDLISIEIERNTMMEAARIRTTGFGH